MAGNETGLNESFACNLSFADAGVGVYTPSDFSSGDVFIACNLCCDPLSVDEIDSDYLFEVTPVIPDPFSDDLRIEGGWIGCFLHGNAECSGCSNAVG